MPWSSLGFLYNHPFRHEMFRPLFCRSAPFPLVLGCSRPLVGVDAEGSEVVQETPHPLFFLAPIQPALTNLAVQGKPRRKADGGITSGGAKDTYIYAPSLSYIHNKVHKADIYMTAHN